MLEELKTRRVLEQEYAVYSILKNFGREFTYTNENGNLAISKKVLKRFRDISGDIAVWERGERQWRVRSPRDAPGRMQD